MPDISILLPDLRGGGAERVMLDLACEFDRRGHSVEFILMQARGEFLPEAQRRFPVVNLEIRRMRSLPCSLARHLRRHKPKSVIANMWPMTSVAVAARLVSRHDCRLMLVEHITLTSQYSSWGRLHARLMAITMAATYPFADVVVAVSAGVASDMAQLTHIDSGRIEVVHNPVPRARKPSDEAIRSAEMLWRCDPGQRILTVGSFKEQKNHGLLLRAFSQVDNPAVRLMLLGQGQGERALRELAAELGLSDRVIFAGFHQDPSPFYATADLFVLSSDYEGLPTALIEAMSFGLPVVSTDCPSGPAEILERGRFGYLVPVGDAPALARAIDKALRVPMDRRALIDRADDFAPEIAAHKYLGLLGLS